MEHTKKNYRKKKRCSNTDHPRGKSEKIEFHGTVPAQTKLPPQR